MKLGTLIPKLQDGGAERVASTLSIHFDESIEQSFCFFRDLPIEYEHKGSVEILGLEPSSNMFKKAQNFFQRIRAAKSWKKKQRLDVCISHLPGANMVNVLSRQNEKVVLVVHSTPSKLYASYLRPFIKPIYKKADQIVAVSNEIREDLIQNFHIDANKITSIFNPLGLEKLADLKREGLNEAEKEYFENETLIYVGRISFEKAQWYGIRAMAELIKDKPKLQLLILGKGSESEESYLKDLCKDLDLEKNVHFLGFQSNPFKFLHAADAFLLTSLTEGMPVSVLEAFACNTKVIAANCSGIYDLLQPKQKEIKEKEVGKHGMIVPLLASKKLGPGDTYDDLERELISAIKYVLETDMSSQVEAAVLFSNQFNAPNIAKKYEALFSRLIHNT